MRATGEQQRIIRVEEKRVYKNDYVAVYDDTVIMPSGRPESYHRVVESEGRPSVAALPMAGDLVGLVKTFRYPIDDWEWAIPRGFAQHDDPAVSVRNELTEELGDEPEKLIELGISTPNSGLLSSRVRIYLALYDKPTTATLDLEEVQELRWLPSHQLVSWVRDGIITDGFTLAAMSLAAIRGHLTLTGPAGRTP